MEMLSLRVLLLLVGIALLNSCVVFCFKRDGISPPELLLSFVVLDFDFGSEEERQTALESKAFIPKNCFLNKVESYRGSLYVATPRLYSGIPFSLVKIVEDRSRGAPPVLRPFPNRDIHDLGDCNDIQMSLSFTIDTNTDIMWILDAGHIVFPDADDPFRISFCPAKVVAVNMRKLTVVSRYQFPESVVPAETNILNDIVLDYVKGELAFIYITDTGSEAIVVYDVKKHTSFSLKHSSMTVDPTATIAPFPNGLPPLDIGIGIDGIAMSCDFQYVYYKVFSSFDFYRIPAHVLRSGGQDFDAQFEHLGRRNHHVDGMMYSTKDILYFSAVNESAIDRWFVAKDASLHGSSENGTMEHIQRIAQHDLKMEYADAIAINEKGEMFFMANRLNRLFQGDLDVAGNTGTNFHIWKQKLSRGERSYLWRAQYRTASWRKYVSIPSVFPYLYFISNQVCFE